MTASARFGFLVFLLLLAGCQAPQIGHSHSEIDSDRLHLFVPVRTEGNIILSVKLQYVRGEFGPGHEYYRDGVLLNPATIPASFAPSSTLGQDQSDGVLHCTLGTHDMEYLHERTFHYQWLVEYRWPQGDDVGPRLKRSTLFVTSEDWVRQRPDPTVNNDVPISPPGPDF